MANGDDQQFPLSPEELEGHKGYEGALDAQTILGLSWPILLTTYNVGSRPPFQSTLGKTENSKEPYLTCLQYMLAKDDLPHVISKAFPGTIVVPTEEEALKQAIAPYKGLPIWSDGSRLEKRVDWSRHCMARALRHLENQRGVSRAGERGL
ncbi:hypothetical protein BDV29DRAFT_171144 [Aspergillus leporis]|uniref:Uncharacterized protein n=1 Tax=Aspergillus leporis TaxID=41062 RepID=A0A5N5X9P1_9EURO|nr:hypothetical protein BDV29DRAFT_171144 [Aspergillus leporis]